MLSHVGSVTVTVIQSSNHCRAELIMPQLWMSVTGPRTSGVAQPLKAHAHGDPEKQAQKLGHTCLIDKQMLSVHPVSLLMSLTLSLITGNPSSAAQEFTGLLAGGCEEGERRERKRRKGLILGAHSVAAHSLQVTVTAEL